MYLNKKICMKIYNISLQIPQEKISGKNKNENLNRAIKIM